MIAARIIADSISEAGHRLTTMEVDCHRFILPELNTHRVFSRNSASSRAIPLARRIQQVREDPAMPIHWGANRPGMQATEELGDVGRSLAEEAWREAARHAAGRAQHMAEVGLHKQVAARILEPFLWHRVLISSTEWENFYRQRCHPDAQPEMRAVAEAMRDAQAVSMPAPVAAWGWHTPYVTEEERDALGSIVAIQVSVARCARVSYLPRSSFTKEEDLALYARLETSGHWSPFEHVATPYVRRSPGNFTGWVQLRHTLGAP